MEKKWVTTMDEYSLFDFNFRFNVNEETFKNKILDFDVFFLRLANKYKLLNINFENKVNFEDFLNQYYNKRLKEFHNIDTEFKTLTLVNLAESSYYPNFNTSLTVFELKENNYESIEYPIRMDDFSDSILTFSVFNYEELKDLRKDRFWEEEVSFSVVSYSNIWLNIIDLSEIYKSNRKGCIDNTDIAYRLTPRLNSFLRDLKNYIISIGGRMILGEHFSKYVTKDGVLLDGKIIYQEDIEQGKIKLPD